MAQRQAIDVRRRQLVETALNIAEQHGLAAVTSRRVATESGVSLGVVHYCFSSTQELQSEMAERVVEDLAEAAMPSLPQARGPEGVQLMLRAAVEAVWARIEASPGRQLLTYELTAHAIRTAGLEDVAKRQYAFSDAAVIGLLEHLSTAAEVSWTAEVSDLARLIVVALDGATLRWLVDRDSARALESLGQVAALIAGQARALGGPTA